MLSLLLTAKIDAMTQKLDKLYVNAVNSCAPSPSCDRCRSLDHVIENCQVGNPFSPPQVKHAAYVNNFQPRPNYDPYFNAHNLVGSSTQTSLIVLNLYPFAKLMQGLHPLDFKEHPFLHKLIPLKKF